MGHSESKVKALEEGLTTSTSSSSDTTTKTAVNTALSSTSRIAKILPTGILFVFQAFSNLLSNYGNCQKSNKALVAVAVAILGIACFVLSFVDTFTDSSTGKVYYGIATINGIATTSKVKPSNASDYKIKWKDFLHASLAVLVFAVMALTNQNVVQCLYPSAETNVKKVFQVLPIALSGASSVIFLLLPSKRQGITTPVTTTSK
uniref:TSA: Wollemia nobilis Ref_Wollemi_Transcript_14239_971 transcribed RNA sequence n=1 Tax=Wollemia nobilis TaxID=56998 RepID=A0A0C9RT25_9CONI